MSRISDFLHAFAGWYAQLTLLRRVLLASALLIVLTPVLITLVLAIRTIWVRLCRSRNR